MATVEKNGVVIALHYRRRRPRRSYVKNIRKLTEMLDCILQSGTERDFVAVILWCCVRRQQSRCFCKERGNLFWELF